MILGLERIPKRINYKKVILCTIIALILIGGICFASVYQIKKQDEQNKEIESKILSKSPTDHKVEVAIKTLNYAQIKQTIENIYHLEGKNAFLTFDDGPSKSVTPFLLDTLKNQNVKAIFFTLGSRVDLNPDIVKREKQEGHYIANHGYSHIYDQIYVSPQTVLDEYNRTEQAIQNALQDPTYQSHLFRFPGGSHGSKYGQVKADAIGALDTNQVTYVDWNALTADSAGKHTKEEMLAYVKETIGTKQNVVILMHDAGDKILTAEILPDLICYLKEQGYNLPDIQEVMQKK